MGKRKFGRSGAFRRKRGVLVNQIIKRHQPQNVAVDNNVVQSEEESFVSKETEMEKSIAFETGGVFISEAENVVEINDDSNQHENQIKTRDFPFNHMQFKSALASWAVNSGIKHEHLRGLLHIWNKYVPLPTLPVDPRTLLGTPRTITIKENYWHRGLKCALLKILSKCVNVLDSLSLKFNTDGITISKSSGMECWPILVEIAELSDLSPEIVGVYCGQGKPKNLESYLRDFVNEFKELLSNGFIYNGCILNVKLKCFICDSPARAALKSRFYIILRALKIQH